MVSKDLLQDLNEFAPSMSNSLDDPEEKASKRLMRLEL